MYEAPEVKKLVLKWRVGRPYISPNQFYGGKDKETASLVFDRLRRPVHIDTFGAPILDYYYMVEAKYIDAHDIYADIWQVSRIDRLNDWYAQVTFTHITRMHNGVFDPIPELPEITRQYRTICLQAIAAVTFKRP